MRYFYVDTCVYINLWRKEVDKSGKPLWKLAQDFFKKIENENSIIYYSGYLLKEIMFAFDENKFVDKLILFNYTPSFKRLELSKDEYKEAISLKNNTNLNLSLFDIIHALLARKSNSILITRDRDLIQFAKNMNVIVRMPEEIL